MSRMVWLAVVLLAGAAAPLWAQNQVVNPGFDKNLSGWTVFNAAVTRSNEDANGSSTSGAARIVLHLGGPEGFREVLAQCLPVASATVYVFSAKVRVQEAGAERIVGDLRWFSGPGCIGDLGGHSLFTNGPAGPWHLASFPRTSLPGAKFVRVSLKAGTRFDGSPHTTRWDDVYFGPPAPPTCTPDATTLCLDRSAGDARFLVRGTFSTVQSGGLAGPANAVSLASLGVGKGGVFWFFNSANPEMLVKVLDGCSSTGFFWVFVSAGTNVGVELFVADTVRGAVALFHNPDLGPYPAIQNSFALPCE